MPSTPIELVVFDLGGVLVRCVGSWEEAHERAGLAPHPLLSAIEFRDQRSRLAHEHQAGRMDAEVYYAAVADISQGVYTADAARLVMEAWICDQYPGVDAVFDALELAGLETATLSNTNAPHWARLFPEVGASVEFPVLARIDHPHASHLLGHVKPDPAIYRAFEAATGRSGGQILYFDDLRGNIGAARELGWRAELIDPAADPASQMLRALRWHRLLED